MSKRALIIEDDGNIAELLRLYLGKDGFEVMIAPDGGKAESSFDLFQPDVVLLDIMLPIKDGWQICRDIRKKSSVPIIMLTAKGETNDKVSGLEMGADDYVTKPFEVKELIARVHAVMRRKDGETAMEKKLDFDKLTQFAKDNAIDLSVCSMDDPLCAGIVDAFEAKGLKIFGTRANAAIIEGSKAFSKDLMKKYGIPTAKYETFTEMDAALQLLSIWRQPPIPSCSRPPALLLARAF